VEFDVLKSLSTRKTPTSVPIHLLSGRNALAAWLKGQPKTIQNWVQSSGFRNAAGDVLLLPGKEGNLRGVLACVANLDELWQSSKLSLTLPHGRYYFETPLTDQQATELSLGWALGTYRFDRYKPTKRNFAELVWPAGADRALVEALVHGIGLGRDLINTPAEDLGPAELAAEVARVAKQFGAEYREVVGQDLLKQNYPCIHAVGRASVRAPRLVDMRWGNPAHPLVTLVGKGVCFDSGGLDIKPADAMKLMKKDMGGAATVLAVALGVMQLKLPVRLRVLIPAVENSIDGNAFRPLDVLRTRAGLTVEVGNTDAEGRLILSDALTDADAEHPDLLVDIATLTGAARVALGTSLPALFSNSDEVAEQLLALGRETHDPLWRLPLFAPYRRMLDSKVAHMNNVAAGSYAGAITAALFLQEFVSSRTKWLHIDSMAFNLEAQHGRPVGGEVFAARALLKLLRDRYPHATP
jgi:leucyl aminopeptidase